MHSQRQMTNKNRTTQLNL